MRERELESWCKCSWTLQSGAPVYSHCFIKYAYWLHTEKKSLRDPSYVHVVVPSMLVVPCQSLPFDSMQIIIIIIYYHYYILCSIQLIPLLAPEHMNENDIYI